MFIIIMINYCNYQYKIIKMIVEKRNMINGNLYFFFLPRKEIYILLALFSLIFILSHFHSFSLSLSLLDISY